jgi:two-component system chemotaxis response regulator CheY
MDVVMPTMEGTEALKKIMDMDPEAKVIMCSSIGQQSVVKEAIDIGAQDFIVKPFDADKVMEVVNRVV